jgi:hypothetical protein
MYCQQFTRELNTAAKIWYSISLECHNKNLVYDTFRVGIFKEIETLYNRLVDFELDGSDLDHIRNQVEAEEPFPGRGENDAKPIPDNENNFFTYFNRTSKLINRYKEALDTVDFSHFVAGEGDWKDSFQT